MGDQILPLTERIPSDYEEQRKYAIRKIEEIRDRATMEMEPWVNFLKRIEATRPTVYVVNPEHWNHIQPHPPQTGKER